MWVKSEYAGELAVLSAWIAMLLPWNVSMPKFGKFGSSLFLRFPILQVQQFGVPGQTGVRVTQHLWIADPITATMSPSGVSRNIAHINGTWSIGALFLVAAFLLSLAMYFREDQVEQLATGVRDTLAAETPVPEPLASMADPVRLMGLLLLAGATVLSVATYQLWTYSLGNSFDQGSIPAVPIGIPIVFFLAYTLLRVDRRKFDDESTDSTPEPAAETEA